jgi:hypothetical protein
MGYVNWKEWAGFCVHCIYDAAVSLCFYNTASCILSFPCFYKHYRDIYVYTVYIISFSRVTTFFGNKLLTRKCSVFISFKREEFRKGSESCLQNKSILDWLTWKRWDAVFDILDYRELHWNKHITYLMYEYCDMTPESRNMTICWATLRSAHSSGNAE